MNTGSSVTALGVLMGGLIHTLKEQMRIQKRVRELEDPSCMEFELPIEKEFEKGVSKQELDEFDEEIKPSQEKTRAQLIKSLGKNIEECEDGITKLTKHIVTFCNKTGIEHVLHEIEGAKHVSHTEKEFAKVCAETAYRMKGHLSEEIRRDLLELRIPSSEKLEKSLEPKKPAFSNQFSSQRNVSLRKSRGPRSPRKTLRLPRSSLARSSLARSRLPPPSLGVRLG